MDPHRVCVFSLSPLWVPTVRAAMQLLETGKMALGRQQPKLLSPKLEKSLTSAWTVTKRNVFALYGVISLTASFQCCRYEFGGPWGVAAIMSGFPILMYYLWICLWFYDGKLVYPDSTDDIQPFFWRMWEHVRKVI